jgi:hypothetical protein
MDSDHLGSGASCEVQAHTPGPWSIHKHSSTAVVGSSGFVVAACGGFSSNTIDAGQLSAELEANTRLIAAAPELLQVLKIAEAALASRCAFGDADICRAAIVKATGA